ncbi:TOTE conflict system archaeo-eukaryotic primase domain-containing protein [Methanococcoides cohabitans]|uniref:TOTE conflict system primase domain-containing protein n=1 Tax=Methanococcoides cohabitans TaxID=3136559 RepID=A0ABU9KVP2_9EURY
MEKSKFKTGYGTKYIKNSDKIIDQHINGNKTLDFRPVLDGDTVKSIHFDCQNIRDAVKILIYCYSDAVHGILEKVDSKYRLWIFIEEIEAYKAKLYCENTLKNCGFALRGNNKTVDYFPKSAKVHSRNSRNAMSLLPFGKGSKILIDGEFVEDFDTIEIDVVDISAEYNYPEPKMDVPVIACEA